MAFSVGDRVTVQAGVHAGLGAEVVFPLKSGKYFVIIDGFSTTQGQRVYREQSLRLEVVDPDPDPDPDPEPTATLYVATSGSDSNPGTLDAPVASFAAAYERANPGDVVEVAAGSYGYQNLLRATKDSATPVVFRPARTSVEFRAEPLVAQVELSGLGFGNVFDDLGAHNIEVQDMTVSSWLHLRRCENITLRNVRIDGLNGSGGKNIQFLGGEWGINNPTDGAHPEFRDWYRPGQQPVGFENILIQDVEIHAFHRSEQNQHVNALHFWTQAGQHRNLTVRNCRFHDNDIFSSLINDVDGVLFEGNEFGVSTDHAGGDTYYSLMLGSGLSNVSLKSNQFDQSVSLNPGPAEGVQACGNTGEVPDTWKQACS